MLKTRPQKELLLEEAVWTEFPFQDPAHTGARSPQSHPNACQHHGAGPELGALPLSGGVGFPGAGVGGRRCCPGLRAAGESSSEAAPSGPGRAACGAAVLPFRSVAKAALGGGTSDGAVFDIKIQFSLASGQVGVCLLWSGALFSCHSL